MPNLELQEAKGGMSFLSTVMVLLRSSMLRLEERRCCSYEIPEKVPASVRDSGNFPPL
jgi:hypothetical protein